MFETFSYFTLQQYWWVIIAILGSTLLFMMFVQGGQTLIHSLSKTEKDKSLIVNAFGKHYKLTFSVLITFGGAIFASFPIFYATTFGGAYFVWMAILFVFIIQAVSYEYRIKAYNFLGQRTYETLLLINGFFGPFLIGVAIATFFTGSNFIIETSNLVNINAASPVITSWTTAFYGLEALWNIREFAFVTNIALGLTFVFITRILANLYIINHIGDKGILLKNIKSLINNTFYFLIVFGIFIYKLLTISGFNYDTITKVINIEEFKYLNNLIDMPLISLTFLLGVILFLLGIWLGLFKKSIKGFWVSGFGTFLVGITIFILAGFNHTSFYPSLASLQSSLTIDNSSSSQYTLIVMSYVSILIPFVLAYTVWAWRVISPVKMTKTNLKKDFDTY